jgi:uncharacterized protein YggU (UPF0235/DUF167 family)
MPNPRLLIWRSNGLLLERVHGHRCTPPDPSPIAVISFVVHVHPGSRQRRVGGSYDGALVVRVGARAVEGAATAETLRLIATAFGLRASAVSLERGAHSRTKTVTIDGDDDALRQRLAELIAQG